jgi:hypothetical protein
MAALALLSKISLKGERLKIDKERSTEAKPLLRDRVDTISQ